MIIDTDFHSHVSPSSAYEMVQAAQNKGLRVLGISEHVFQMRTLLANGNRSRRRKMVE